MTVPACRNINWTEFFTRYRSVAVRCAAGWVRSPHQAEDLFQEAARSVYERFQREPGMFRSDAHLRNYFFRSLRNLAVSGVREVTRRKTSGLDDASQVASSDAQPFELASREEQSLLQARRFRAIEIAAASLKPREREALKMRYADGLGFREMSEKTGTSISTLQARVEAALAKIRKKIGKDGMNA